MSAITNTNSTEPEVPKEQDIALPNGWNSWSDLERGLWFMQHYPTPTPPPPPFEPIKFFFYGSLMVPEILRSVLGLEKEEEIVYRPAATNSRVMKMWGEYPALVFPKEPEYDYDEDLPVEELEWIHGLLYEVQTENHLEKLTKYEGEMYIQWPLNVKSTVPGEEDMPVFRVQAFEWRSFRSHHLLTDGKFDLEAFRKSRLPLDTKVPA